MRRIRMNGKPRFKSGSGLGGKRASGKSVRANVVGDDSIDGNATGNEIGDPISVEIAVSGVFGAESRLCKQPQQPLRGEIGVPFRVDRRDGP